MNSIEFHNPHFLLTRLSHIGDCVLTLPVLEAIKQRWPHSRVTWAMESPTHKLLGHHPLIDEILLIPRGYLTKPSQLWQLRQQLQAAKIDVVIDPQSLSKSAVLGWLSGAKIRLGFGGRYGKECSTWLNNRRIIPSPSATHLTDRSLELLDELDKLPLNFLAKSGNGLNAYKNPARLHLPLPQAAVDWVVSAQQQSLLPQTYVVLNPGASWPSKRWENDRWAEVAAWVAKHWCEVVVTWAGEEELAWAEEISSRAGLGVRVAPDTSLLQLAALNRKAELFLGCDTGPMHIAAAVETRCLVLFGPTLPNESGPYGADHVCLQAWHQVEESGRKKQAENRAMRDITVPEVSAAIQKCLTVEPTQDRRTA